MTTEPGATASLFGVAPELDAIYVLVIILVILSLILEVQCIIHFFYYARSFGCYCRKRTPQQHQEVMMASTFP
ncbi:hypothetical protein [Cynomolgus macaque cytomegalovirus strain Mauritius]|uniref:Uncharacterized protein n=1 Tax=Cynomolgus macaque cytomegalovirus strain Mauritius TaxID=1690255 RepID=A0A0K1H0D8_9BETA|nr:hypothetical protein [Cynomolgus macaque cytomegalovirus strain Mauritius]AXG21710.1 hypothetical protein [synthetic construct]AXG21978.1 hypothetical protein [synthetic construct]